MFCFHGRGRRELRSVFFVLLVYLVFLFSFGLVERLRRALVFPKRLPAFLFDRADDRPAPRVGGAGRGGAAAAVPIPLMGSIKLHHGAGRGIFTVAMLKVESKLILFSIFSLALWGVLVTGGIALLLFFFAGGMI